MPKLSDRNSSFTSYIVRLLAPHKRAFLLNACNVLIRSGLYLAPPLMTKYVLERILPQHNWNLLLAVCVCTIVCPIVGSFMILYETYIFRVLDRMFGHVRSDLYDGCQYTPLESFTRMKTGDRITRILDDTKSISDFACGNIMWMLMLTATIVCGSVAMLIMHPGLALIVLALWGGHSILIVRLGAVVKHRSAETAKQTSNVTETLREIVSGAGFIKASGMENKAIDAALAAFTQEKNVSRGFAITDQAVHVLHASLQAAFLVVMYYAGGRFVVHGQMTIGSLVAFIAVYNWLRPLGVALYETYLQSRKAAASVERIQAVSFPALTEAGIIPTGDRLDIVADRICYAYDREPVLCDDSFTIPAGSVVSVVGKRGSGKSTLADILLRLRKPASGTVTIGGIPLELLDESWLRRHMLCITQDVLVRSGTILDNIVYGSEEADPGRIAQALRIAELEQWIATLPDGLQTEVGEQGYALSGGERQRISIARAILRKPSILILDEATSALDQGTERRLLDQLLREMAGSTLIFITHRPAIIAYSDQVLVMNEGGLNETDGSAYFASIGSRNTAKGFP